jgi:glycosyltransferase involved in cell wall biosynthesis
MHAPLVSVVIPTYNRAGIICQAIDNLLQQTYSNFELIVVDDGSADDTPVRLAAYGDKIRVIRQANAGPAVARNRGAEIARGEIIAFQDSDDLWEPTKLERQVVLLEKAGMDVPCCLTNVLMRVADGKRITSFDESLIRFQREEGIWLNVAEVLASRFVLFNQAAAIRREAWKRVGGFDNRLKYLEDYDLPLRLALEGPWAFIQEPLVLYREGTPESFSQAALKDVIVLRECEVTICERMLARVPDNRQSKNIRSQLKRRLKRASRKLFAARLDASNSPGARLFAGLIRESDRYLLAGFRRSPWFPKPRSLPVEFMSKPRAADQGVDLVAHQDSR